MDGVNLSLEEGKFIVILGSIGAGKSTLLNMLGGLNSPTSGTITVCEKDISTLTNNELADYRASNVGFIFQFYNLIPALTVQENVELVKEIAPNALNAKQTLSEVGLAAIFISPSGMMSTYFDLHNWSLVISILYSVNCFDGYYLNAHKLPFSKKC